MAKKPKLLKYNLTGQDLENYEKVKEYKLETLAQVQRYLKDTESKVQQVENIYNFFKYASLEIENVGVYEKNKDFILAQLENGEKTLNDLKQNLANIKEKETKLSNQFNTYFENLPIKNGVAFVEKEIVDYCNIEVKGI